jgi:catechol 2,3-dioxygenase-like lactoylglutathione lyase family enzyme
MLNLSACMAVIPAKDMDRARNFYENTLGFKVDEATPGGTVFLAGDNTRFFVYPTEYAGTGQHTIAAFRVSDVVADVADLRSRGVEFNDYDMGDLVTVDGIATLGDLKSAWFTDPEGNVIAISDG